MCSVLGSAAGREEKTGNSKEGSKGENSTTSLWSAATLDIEFRSSPLGRGLALSASTVFLLLFYLTVANIWYIVFGR